MLAKKAFAFAFIASLKFPINNELSMSTFVLHKDFLPNFKIFSSKSLSRSRNTEIGGRPIREPAI